MSGSQEDASAVADGRLSDGSRSSQVSPRTPEGPSETRMRRSPIFSSGQVFQKSRPVSSCTFSSRVSCPRACLAASPGIWSVIEITFRSLVLVEDADVPGTELDAGAGGDLLVR